MTDENPIKPIAPGEEVKSSQPTRKVTTVKVTRGNFMSDDDGGTGIFDPGQRTVLPGNRPKRGKFMES